MADTTTPTGTLNMWHRSSDITTLMECQSKYLLERMFGRDADAGYFINGTAAHGVAEDVLQGGDLDEAIDEWRQWAAEEIAASDEVRWTAKRPAEEADDLIVTLAQKWHAAVIEPETRINPYSQGITCAQVELHTRAPSPGGLIHTQIDSVWSVDNPDAPFGEDGTWIIIDWKTGATAKANPVQLWVYMYAATHDPDSPLYWVDPDIIELAFHHIAFNKVQYVNDYPGDTWMERLFEWAEEQKIAMSEYGFAPAKPDWWCDYCLVSSKCPVKGGDLDVMMEAAMMASLELEPNEGEDS